MNDPNAYNIVFEATKNLESILETKFGANGPGLHAKAISVGGYLGEGLVKKIQFLATIRNKLAHESDFHDVPLDGFRRTNQQVVAALDAMDPPEKGARIASPEYGPGRGSSSGRAFGLLAVFAIIVVVWIIAASSGRTRTVDAMEASSLLSKPAPSSLPPLWSVDHPQRDRQAFAWREEQAAFIASGETDPLPNETLWKVTSAAREVKAKDGGYLEMDMELGGGKTKGKVRFAIGDSFGKSTISNSIKSLEVGGRRARGREAHGLALKADGSSFRGFDPYFKCAREISGGCAAWDDEGVAYVAVSLISFDNVLKVVYGR